MAMKVVMNRAGKWGSRLPRTKKKPMYAEPSDTHDVTFTQRQLIGLLGSIILFLGVFMPIVSVPW